ncbi:hypothetical protein SLE2022_311490 [Rubroshorea leprosula]
MSHLEKESRSREENPQFKWGILKAVGQNNKNVKFYESFTYDGVEYFLYDCVYFNIQGSPETSIGKIVKIYENSTSEKRVKVVWFLRPTEIRNHLGDYVPCWNELFLASGEGVGLSSLVLLKFIAGKCNVVCASHDHRNPQASKAAIRMADYIFHRTFDVGKLAILETFPDNIDGVKVEYFFNRRIDQKPISAPNLKAKVDRTAISGLSSKSGVNKVIGTTIKKESKKDAVNVSELKHPPDKSISLKLKASSHDNGTGTARSSQCLDKLEAKVCKDSSTRATNVHPYKKRKFLMDEESDSESDKEAAQLAEDKAIKTKGQLMKVTSSLDANRGNWFHKLPWEQRLQTAQESGTLLLLENLDPSFTSAEVQDLVRDALKMRVEAKMIQQTAFSSPYYGKALVILQSKKEVELAISKLEENCLMLANGRPIVASKVEIEKPNKQAGFVGHLLLDKFRVQRQNQERKKAVSTSHCSQPNTIEYDLAMEWCMLQEKSDLWWKALYEEQAKEIEVSKQLKMISTIS